MDVFSKEQMIELINLGFDPGDCKYSHVTATSSVTGTEFHTIVENPINLGDTIKDPIKSTSIVTNVIPAVSVIEALDYILASGDNGYKFGIHNGLWEVYHNNVCIGESLQGKDCPFVVIKFMLEK